MTEIIKILTDANIRPSYQRLSILKVLKSTDTHPTADQLYTMLKENNCVGISKATLYNTLQLFCEKGIIIRVDMSSSEAHYDANIMFHPHFVCEACGKIIDCNVVKIPEIKFEQGFKVQKFTMNISGLCPQCSSKI